MLVLLAVLGTMCAGAGAQMSDDEHGVWFPEEVYGVRPEWTATGYVNSDPITVLAWGSTRDATLYGNAAVLAYGISTGTSVTNAGAIAVTATGGAADSDSGGPTARSTAYGIFAFEPITNSGSIDVMAAGGTVLGKSTRYVDYTEFTYASAQACGLYDYYSRIDNTVGVKVTSTGGTATLSGPSTAAWVLAEANAYGLYLDDEVGNPYTGGYGSNSGDLTITAQGGSAQGPGVRVTAMAWAYGIKAVPEISVSNSGRIAVTATGGNALGTWSDTSNHWTGVYARAFGYGIQSSHADLDNRGAVTVVAAGGTATSPNVIETSARAEVIALQAGGDRLADLRVQAHNAGAITATATGGAADSTSGNADAYATAYGLSTTYATVNNVAPVTVAAQGGSVQTGASAQAQATAYGLSTSDGDVTNAGPITVTAEGGTAQAGAQAMAQATATGLSGNGGILNNSGRITVTAIGGTAHGQAGYAYAGATGLATADADLRNSGDITVTGRAGNISASHSGSTGATATAIYSYHSNVTNTGNITAMAGGPDGLPGASFGIRLDGANRLTNTGVIRATGNPIYELYGHTGSATTLVDTYNVTLDGDPSRASIYVGDEATLALNHATLTATAIPGETRWGREYKLFETQGTGTVEGSFADVRAVNPNTTVTYYDQGTAGSVDDTVSLAYTPLGSPTVASAAVERQTISRATNVINDHMTTTVLQGMLFPSSSGLLASASSTEESLVLAGAPPDKSQGVFVEPYYSLLDKDANPLGYQARLWGFSAGYERFLGNTLAGLHLGYGQADIGYTGAGYSANSEDQDIVTGGFHGLTTWDPWTLRYGLTGFYARHDYEGLTGLALDTRETAAYDSYGTAATLMAGHLFRWGPHVLLPEAGLNWLWTHRARYTTEAADPSWNTTYSAANDHDLHATMALRWLSTFLYDDIHITPSAALGLRHLLTDAQASAWQSVPGAAPVLVRSEQDRTALTLSGSLTLTRIRHAMSLAYDGDYAPNAHQHSVWLRYSWLF
jgi:hypothetical protein